ncbi:MAG: ASKHA domain-containing protein [Nitrospirota bacterium]
MQSKVKFLPSGKSGEIKRGETILGVARGLGLEVDSLCGGQGVCGKCRVKIVSGGAGAPSAEEKKMLSASELSSGVRLACMAVPDGDIVVKLPERREKSDRILTGSALAAPLEIAPALKAYHVRLPEPSEDHPAADAERLLAVLDKTYGLRGLRVSYHALKKISQALRSGGWEATALVRHGEEITDIRPGYAPKVYGAAFDIGTTTIASYLAELSEGVLLASEGRLNPQSKFGADIMSRITWAARPGGLSGMHSEVTVAINDALGNLTAAAGISAEEVSEVVFVGNTVMHHALLRLPMDALGVYPFTPALSRMAEFPAHELGIDAFESAGAVALPIIGGMIGSDLAAAVLADGMCLRDEVTLLMDLGTNGELAIGNRKRLIAASCATGPAFEGAQIRHGMRAESGAIERVVIDPETLEASYKVIGYPGWSVPGRRTGAKGICGSGIMDAVAQMYRSGIINGDGSFNAGNTSMGGGRVRGGAGGPEYVLAWPGETATGQEITVSLEDVRAVQLAKAALSAGAGILMKEFGVRKIDRVVLAGAFGSLMDKSSAVLLGIIPQCGFDDVIAAGNAAGAGAVMALMSEDKRNEMVSISEHAEKIELSMHPDFQDKFLSNMNFSEGY